MVGTPVAYDPMQVSKTHPENFTMMFKKTLLAAAMIAFGGFAMTATAATTVAGGTFQVSITIQSSCAVSSGAGSNLNIGSVPANTPIASALLKGSSNISVTCSNTTPYIIGLKTTDGTAGTGHMNGPGGNVVPYSLFQDSGYSTAWGSTGTAPGAGTQGNDLPGVGDGTAHAIPVYAQVTNPNFQPGTYADTVTVSLIY